MRKRILTVAAVAIAATVALAGCGTSNSHASSGVLTVGRGNGTQTDNSNPFVSSSSAQSLGYGFVIYEPLVQVNQVRPAQKPVPWLATAWKWSSDYTSVEFTVRNGVKWSDGTTMTPADVAYSLELRKDNSSLNSDALPYKNVTTKGDKVTVSFTSPEYTNQFKVMNLFIVPKHIWSKIADPAKALNQQPVGTGPYALKTWTAQAVTLTARTNYWGGVPKAKTMRFTTYNDNASFTTALTTGAVEWGQGFIPNIDKIYVSKDPKHNTYWFPGELGIDYMALNTQQAPFNNVAVRKAVNLVVNRTQISKVAESGIFPEVTSQTGIPLPQGSSFVAAAYSGKSFAVDVAAAKKILTDAGYTYNSAGELVGKDGKQVSFVLTDPAGWSDYLTQLQLVVADVKQIGIAATVDSPSVDAWTTNLANGTFQAAVHWTNSGATPYDMYSSMFDGVYNKPVGQTASWNFGRFTDAASTKAFANFQNSSDPATRQAALAVIEKTFVQNVPVIAMDVRPELGIYSTKSWIGWPSAANPYADPAPTGNNMSLIVMKLTPAK